MESKSEAPLGMPNAISPSFGDRRVQVGFLLPHQYSEGKNNDKMTQKVSGKPSASALYRDPSFPGTLIHTYGLFYHNCEFNPIQYYLLKQLYNATKSPYI